MKTLSEDCICGHGCCIDHSSLKMMTSIKTIDNKLYHLTRRGNMSKYGEFHIKWHGLVSFHLLNYVVYKYLIKNQNHWTS